VLTWFSQYFSQLGYLLIGVAALAEGLTIPCPSLAVLLMAGAACATGKLSFWLTVFIAAASYTLGSLVPYYLGRQIPRLKNLPWAGRIVESSLRALDQVNCLFQRHGEKIVALARPFWIGNCVSYFAGLSRMSCLKFLVYTFAGISVWTITVVYIGQEFSNNLPKAAALIQHYSGLAFIVLVLALLAGWKFLKFGGQHGISTARD